MLRANPEIRLVITGLQHAAHGWAENGVRRCARHIARTNFPSSGYPIPPIQTFARFLKGRASDYPQPFSIEEFPLPGGSRTSICCASSGGARAIQPTGLSDRAAQSPLFLKAGQRCWRATKGELQIVVAMIDADLQRTSTTPSGTRSATMCWSRSAATCAIWSGILVARFGWSCACTAGRNGRSSARSGRVSPLLNCTAMVNACWHHRQYRRHPLTSRQPDQMLAAADAPYAAKKAGRKPGGAPTEYRTRRRLSSSASSDAVYAA